MDALSIAITRSTPSPTIMHKLYQVVGLDVHRDRVRVAMLSYNKAATIHFDFKVAERGGKAAVLDAIESSDFGEFSGPTIAHVRNTCKYCKCEHSCSGLHEYLYLHIPRPTPSWHRRNLL